MFLEPLSQIVAKELVGAVEMDLSVEKVRLIRDIDPVVQGNRVGEICLSGKCFQISQTEALAEQFAGHAGEV